MKADTGPTEGGHEEPVRNGHRRDADDDGRAEVVVERLDDGAVQREAVELLDREGAVELPGQEGAAEEPDREPPGEQSATGQPVEHPTTERPTADHPATERPTVEQPTVERPAVERPAEEGLTHRRLRTLLLALPVGLAALWAALHLPLQLGLVLGAMAALPVALVAVPWLVSVAATAWLDRGL